MLDGDKVKEACEALGLSGQGLAEMLHVTPGTISKIVGEYYPGTSLDLAERMAWILHKPLCALLKDAQPGHQHGAHGAVDAQEPVGYDPHKISAEERSKRR